VSSRGPLGPRLRREFAGAPAETQLAARRRRQAGYTLIELIVASAIGLLVMGALTSVVLTSVLATNTATSRVEAGAQIRNFQLTAYDDFALSRPPAPAGCGTQVSPCTTQDMILMGSRMPNQTGGVAAPFTARYTWDPNQGLVTRFVGAASRVVASDVNGYSWYVDPTGEHPVVVVSMTVTVGFYNTSYTESQTLLFYPRVTSP
jgi:prepilin-type N-terminal cleavage/methylation domain-containing protein